MHMVAFDVHTTEMTLMHAGNLIALSSCTAQPCGNTGL
jgi:hypothetical protein